MGTDRHTDRLTKTLIPDFGDDSREMSAGAPNAKNYEKKI